MNPLDIFPNTHEIFPNTHEPNAHDLTDHRTRRQPAPVKIVLTVEEAAERLGIGRSLMYALVKAGDVESITIGRLRRIPTDALTTYVCSLRCPA